MSADIVERSGGFIRYERGLRANGPVTFSQWMAEGRKYETVIDIYQKNIPWWVGDWIIMGEQLFPEKYSQALSEGMYTIGTLRNCVWVCRNVPIENRRSTLSFAHHQEVAKFPAEKQNEWLSKAEDKAWTAKALRRAVAGDPNPERLIEDKTEDRKEDVDTNEWGRWWNNGGSDIVINSAGVKEASRLSWMAARSKT